MAENEEGEHSLSHTHPRKRIIVCCDGTWMDSDGDVQIPSNVTRLSRCLSQDGIDTQSGRSIPQITYYQAGVGTDSSLFSKYVGGATGKGLSEHIREAYSFICNNYHPGDEIFLIGFSRGAFTARSISSLIRAVGLLTSTGLTYFYQIFQDWEFQLKKGWKSPYPTEPWPNRPKVTTPEYRRKLLELELTRPDIAIKAVAVWDTVGSLGIPMIGVFPQPPSTDYSFVDTKVEPNIEYAFQALALDEHRRNFVPTIWEKDPAHEWPHVLRQCWFPGCHTDVGGGYTNHDLANVTLAWMISQLDPLLSFDHAYVVREHRLSMERHVAKGQPLRDWGLGKIHNSMTLFFRLGGKKVRSPMEYQATEPKTRVSTGKRLLHTNETVHSSVRVRMGKKGFGYDDKGTYDSEALAGWTMYGVETEETSSSPSPASNALNVRPDGKVQGNKVDGGEVGKVSNVVWKKHDPSSTTTKGSERPMLEMPEEPLGEFERTIMRAWWPDVDRDFDYILPSSHATSVVVKRSSTYPAERKEESAGGSVINGGRNRLENSQRPPERVGTI